MSIILSSYQHCDEQQFKHSLVHFTQFFEYKARFIHTSTVTRLHSCSGKKYAYALRASCFYIEINIFLTFLRQNKQQKVLVFHSVLLGASPRPCSKRADILYYYFHIKEEHFKMFFKTKLYQDIHKDSSNCATF